MTTDYRDRMQAYAQQLMGYKTGEMVSLMVHIGDELGLYAAMSGEPVVTAGASLSKPVCMSAGCRSGCGVRALQASSITWETRNSNYRMWQPRLC
jgi:hypothetical protein